MISRFIDYESFPSKNPFVLASSLWGFYAFLYAILNWVDRTKQAIWWQEKKLNVKITLPLNNHDTITHSMCAMHYLIIISTFDPSTFASYIPVKVSARRCRIHQHTTHQSFAEFGQGDHNRQSLQHRIPESKCVQGLITVKAVSCCGIIVGLIDWEDPHITCKCTGEQHQVVMLSYWKAFSIFFFIIGSRMSSISHPYLPGSTCRWTGRLNTSGRLWSLWGARVAELHCSQRGGSQMVPWAGVSNPDPTGSWECLAAEGSLWSRQHLRRDGSDVKGCSKTIKQRVEDENTDQRWLVPALGQPRQLRQELEGQGLKLVMWD